MGRMPSRSLSRSIGRRPPSTTSKLDAHHARSPYPKTKKRKGRPLLAPPSATLEHKMSRSTARHRYGVSSSLVLSWHKQPKNKQKISTTVSTKKKKKKPPPFFQKKKKKKKKK